MSRRDREQENSHHQSSDPVTRAVVARMKADWPKFSTNILQSESHQGQLTELLLGEHDKPHRNSSIEWWYVKGHVENAADPAADISFFAAFFRLHFCRAERLQPEASVTEEQRAAVLDSERMYVTTWAVTNRTDKTYRPFSFVDTATPKIILEMMNSNLWQGNPYIRQSLQEVFERGIVPAPDKKFTKPVVCDTDKLNISMEGCTFKEIVDGNGGKKKYELHLEGADSAGSINIDCVIEPEKCPMLHGQNGIVAIDHDNEGPEDMFYYFVPRCSLTGTVQMGGAAKPTAVRGTSWYDHEFGGAIPTSREELQVAMLKPMAERNGKEFCWEWVAIQLNNNTEVSAVRLKSDEKLIDSFVLVREGNDGKKPQYRIEGNNIGFFPVVEENKKNTFTSPRTGLSFATKWKLQFKSMVSGENVELTLEAKTLDQEFVTLAAKPSFWEGHVEVSGFWGSNSNKVSGNGFLECRGAITGSVDQLFDMLHAIFCMPLRFASSQLHGSKPEDFREFITKEVDNTIAAAPDEASEQFTSDPALKHLLVSVACAYVFVVKNGKNSRGRALDWLEDRFVAHPLYANPPFHLLFLRAYALREVDIAAGIVPDPVGGADLLGEDAAAGAKQGAAASELSPANFPPPAAGASEQAVLDRVSKVLGFTVPPFHLPADIDAACSRPAADADSELSVKIFPGTWELCRDRSELTSAIMTKQGFNFFLRGLIDRLTPTLTTRVEKAPGSNAMKVISHVKTAVSNEEYTTVVGGKHKWFSRGRGDVTTDACLLEGGRTLLCRTFVPPNQRTAVEYKWMRVENSVEPDGKTRRMTEMYRYDPDGVLNENSLYACRLFLGVAETK